MYLNNIAAVLIIILIFNIALLLFTGWKCIVAFHHRTKRLFWSLVIGGVCSYTVLSFCVFWRYVSPFEQSVDTKLVAVIDIPPENSLDGPGCKFWRAAYEEYDGYAGSRYFNTAATSSPLGFEWPEMDFENYTYIITYGQEIESLSYNVWDTIDVPIRTGAYAGHMVFKEHFNPNEVYVYQIPKMRIDNDI